MTNPSNLPTIILKILGARHRALVAGERYPNVCTLSALAAAQFADWLQNVENDPFLGYTPLGKQIFGMTIREDVTQQEDVIVTHESER